MQPLVPYLLGQKHPLGTRLVNFQKCVRTGDIDDIGDNTHATFFEMVGNWSLGDYFKEDAVKWSYELLTSKEEGFGLDPQRLYITAFEGDDKIPRDTETADIWKGLFEKNGVTGERIYFLGADSNWWPAVKKGNDAWSGPTGPCAEMFYDVTGMLDKGMTKAEYLKADEEQKVVEIGNDVFMEYVKKEGEITGKLEKRNVDDGRGFERLVMVIQGKENIFDTDLFMPIINKIEEFTTVDNLKAKRIIADHLRAATFLIGDGVLPDNKDQGYVLRRLLRRAVRYADTLGMKHGSLFWIADTIVTEYKDAYPLLLTQKEHIQTEIDREENKFRATLEKGMKEFERMASKDISGDEAFLLLSSYGFPLDLTKELAKEKSLNVDEKGFEEEFKKHQDLSRSGSEQKFKGGLSGTGEMETRYHTATHLLNAALREILGDHVSQKGSNITAERMRFDFSHTAKMTDEEKKKVEDLVNQKIEEAHAVSFKEMPIGEAEKLGAIHAFGDKYGDMVKVYSIGNETDGYFSREFCGGPHVSNTKELGHFKIVKEEAVSAGVRRIKAVLE